MGHHCCSKQKVKRGLWSPEEDEKLIKHINNHGHGCWSAVPKLAGLQRCGKSCRLRWINYLRPDLKRGSFNEHEVRIILDVHRILGNRWAQIAKHLPGRTDNEVKNFWNSCIKKKLIAKGVDPNTYNLLSSYKNTQTKQYSLGNATSSLFFMSTKADAQCVDIKTPFVAMQPNSNENSIITTTGAATTTSSALTGFEFQNPNFQCVDIKTPFVEMQPNSNENSIITTTGAATTMSSALTDFEFQNPNFQCVDIKTPFVAMLPNSNENSTIPAVATTTATSTALTNFEFQTPNFVSDFEIKNSHCLMEFASQPQEGLLSSSMNISSVSGILDDNVIWGTTIQQLKQQQQQQQLQENGVGEGVIEKMNEQNLDTSMSLNFELEFIESALIQCGMYCNVNAVDQLAWDC